MIDYIYFKFRRLVKLLEYLVDWAIRSRLKNIITENKLPIVIGPWTGEVGPELQYWIPFLIKLKNSQYFDGHRLIVLSRGGVEQWYSNITNEYIEIFNLITVKEFNEIVSERVAKKQVKPTKGELKLIQKSMDMIGVGDYRNLHPGIMWREVLQWLNGDRSLTWLRQKIDFSLFLSAPQKYKNIVDGLGLPKKYFAVKFYSSNLFPENKMVNNFITTLISSLTKKYPVVLFSIEGIDDHNSIQFDSGTNDKVINISDSLTPSNNLGIQTEVIKRSQGFFGTYGGFSILPAFTKKPSFSFCIMNWSNEKHHYYYHLHESVATSIFDKFEQEYQVLDINTINFIRNNVL